MKDGVYCDVYFFENNDTKDLAIIKILKGHKTPLQKVLKEEKTFEGWIEGKGMLKINNKIYNFPSNKITEVEVKIGETMQWTAKTDLFFYEICYPKYEGGRYKNLLE